MVLRASVNQALNTLLGTAAALIAFAVVYMILEQMGFLNVQIIGNMTALQLFTLIAAVVFLGVIIYTLRNSIGAKGK